MRVLIRIVAALAAVSVVNTLWFVAAFASAGGLRALLQLHALGALTIVGWLIAIMVGPVAVVEVSGHRAPCRHSLVRIWSRLLRRWRAGAPFACGFYLVNFHGSGDVCFAPGRPASARSAPSVCDASVERSRLTRRCSGERRGRQSFRRSLK
jgi:hypothetical protein